MKTQFPLRLFCLAIKSFSGILLVFMLGCQDEGFEVRPAAGDSASQPFGHLETQQNGWVSSGGDLLKTARNPWFLKNVDAINYCIKFDEEAMSISLDQARENIIKAFAYWKREFDFVNRAAEHNKQEGGIAGPTPIGTQTIQEVDCDDKEDLAFIFGTKHLNAAQKNYLKDPTDHLGASVRTSYDPVQMRGRGFIYIAADQGEQKYKGENQLTQALWKENLVLQAMLVHELGHVYGFSHDGTLIMAEGFAEQLVTLAGFAHFRAMDQLPSYLREPEVGKSCMNDRATLDWYEQTVPDNDFDPKVGVSTNWCIVVEMEGGSVRDPKVKTLKWRVSVTNERTSESVALGTFEIHEPQLNGSTLDWPMDFVMRGRGMVFLTPEQKVFAEEDLLKLPMPDPSRPGEKVERVLPYLFTAKPTEYGFQGEYQALSGTHKSVYIQVSPEGYKITGEYKGKQKLIFNSTAVPFF